MNSTLQHPKTPELENIPRTSEYLKWSRRLASTHKTDSIYLRAFADIHNLVTDPSGLVDTGNIRTLLWEACYESRNVRGEENFNSN